MKVRYETQLGLNTSNLPREKWDTWDPTLISEVWLNIFFPHIVLLRFEYTFNVEYLNFKFLNLKHKSEVDFQYNNAWWQRTLAKVFKKTCVFFLVCFLLYGFLALYLLSSSGLGPVQVQSRSSQSQISKDLWRSQKITKIWTRNIS